MLYLRDLGRFAVDWSTDQACVGGCISAWTGQSVRQHVTYRSFRKFRVRTPGSIDRNASWAAEYFRLASVSRLVSLSG